MAKLTDYFEEARQADTNTASTEPNDTTTLAATIEATFTEGSTFMAYPPGVSLATITIGAGRTMFGTPPKLISATVTPIFKGTPHVVHAASGWAFYPTPQTFRVQNGEELTFQLPHVNAEGWRDTAGNEFPALLESGERDKGWAYLVKFTVVGGSGQDSAPHRYEKVFQPLVGQAGPIDVDLVPDGQVGEPVTAPAPAVLSIAGLTGAVTEEQLLALGLGGASDEEIAVLVEDENTSTGTALAQRITTAIDEEMSRSDATYFRPRPATIAFLGDSFTDMSVATNGVTTYRDGRGFITWALQRLGQRVRLVSRAGTTTGGITGQTSTQIAARVQQDVIALAPGYAHVLAGTNDVIGNIPFATTTSALTAIYDAVQGAGIRLIVGTIAPMGGGQTSATLDAIERLNNWIRDQAMVRPGVILADYHTVLAAPSGSWRITGDTSYTPDNVHASTGGAMRMGKVLADALAMVIPATSVLPTSNRDSLLSAATLTYPNMVANPLMVGTSGTLGSTGAAGTVADSWIVSSYRSAGTTSGMTFSKTERTDGPAGDWQVVDSTNTTAELRFQQTINTSANLQPGDRVRAAFEYEFESLTDLILFRVQAATFDAAAGYANRGTVLDPSINTADVPTLPEALVPAKGVLMAPELTYPANATGLTFSIDFCGVGRLRLGRAMLRRYR